MGHKYLNSKLPKLSLGLVLIGLLLATMLPNTAAAQFCSFTNSGINFGSVDLTPGNRVRTTGTFTATCTGTPGNTVRVCANFGSGTGGVLAGGDPRQMTNGANTLDFNLYKNGAYTNIWGSKLWPYPPNPKAIKLTLNGAGTASKSRTIRTEIYAGQPATPAGLYTSSFAGGHTLISYAYTFVGNCNAISGLGGIQIPFSVSANVLGTCTASATDLNFGSAGVLTSNQDASNTVSVTCTSATPYSISLDDGNNGVGDPTARNMNKGPELISYGIYQNAARSTPWGDNIGVNTVSGTGTGIVQNYTAYGRVPIQTTPSSGTYTDTIVVTVTY